MNIDRKQYNALRHTCGYNGANKKRFDPNCPKCVARDDLRESEQEERRAREYMGTMPAARRYVPVSLDDYDGVGGSDDDY